MRDKPMSYRNYHRAYIKKKSAIAWAMEEWEEEVRSG